MVTAGSSGRECSYSHDISGELFDDIAGETWSCPHEYTDSSDYCPVHRSSASAQEVRSFITNACERDDAGRAETQFFGAECSALELGHTVLDDSSLFPVDFRDAIFGGVSMKKSRIRRPITLAGATIRGPLNCKQAVFEQEFDIHGAVIDRDATFEFARFDNWCTVSDTRFKEATFNGAVLSRGIDAAGVHFRGHSEFVNTNFEQLTNFRGATFVERADFDGPEFFLDARFDQSVFDGPAFFETTKFHQVGVFRNAEFNGPVSFRNCLVVERGSFQNAKFGDAALFPGIKFESVATFNGAKFHKGVDLRKASISQLRFKPSVVKPAASPVRFSGAHIGGGVLQVPDSGASEVQLRNATLGDVKLHSSKTELVLDSFGLEDVRYEGFSFDGLEQELPDSGGRLELVESGGHRGWWQSALSILPGRRRQLQSKSDGNDDLENSMLVRTYRKAKNGADRVGESKASSYLFRKEMKYRRKGHWETVHDPEASGTRRLTAGFRWISNAALYVTAGYGERPSWTVVSSVVSILLFAGAYTALGVYTGDASAAESLLFSAQSFVTFIVGGGPEATGFGVELLSVLQGFTGAFLVAVFVFTLTRTVYR